MTEAKTDISDRSFEELAENTDRGILRELAKERDDVNGNGTNEEIAAGLLRSDGRADEIPDDVLDLTDDGDDSEVDDDESEDQSEESDDDHAREESSEVAPDDASDTDSDDSDADADPGDGASDDGEFVSGNDYSPRDDAGWIIEAGALQAWLERLSAHVEEARIHIDSDGLRSAAVDPANVAMVDASLDARTFESFDVPQAGVIGINLNRFDTVVSDANKDALLNINYDATTRNLVVQYGGHEFTLALINPESIRQEPDLPDIDLANTCSTPADNFKTGVSYADDVSDHVALGTDPSGREPTLRLTAEGDVDSYAGEFGSDENVEYESYASDEQVSLLSLDYLKAIEQVLTVDEEITITHGSEMPLYIKTGLGDDDYSGDVTYVTAPRI